KALPRAYVMVRDSPTTGRRGRNRARARPLRVQGIIAKNAALRVLLGSSGLRAVSSEICRWRRPFDRDAAHPDDRSSLIILLFQSLDWIIASLCRLRLAA